MIDLTTSQGDQTKPSMVSRFRQAATTPALATDRATIHEYLSLAVAGLPQFFAESEAAHTARRQRGTIAVLGRNLRYGAIAALGIACLQDRVQRMILAGNSAQDLARRVASHAVSTQEPGELALAAWAAAEVCGDDTSILLGRLSNLLGDSAPVETVVCAWALSAALAAPRSAVAERVRDLSARRLLSGLGPHGLFPHLLPPGAGGRMRAHVGCFADQVYPIQALARLHAATSAPEALSAADACAARICELQGAAGQWWWHYDVRTGGVVEGYPVYSVHQHAMAPMALFDLADAGGADHSDSVAAGLRWIEHHPEIPVDLVDADHGLIWRKIARRDRGKLVRKMAAAISAILPGATLPGATLLFPPTAVDFECRPYELGWMLYAWLSGKPATLGSQT